jgi:hypothetical protein
VRLGRPTRLPRRTASVKSERWRILDSLGSTSGGIPWPPPRGAPGTVRRSGSRGPCGAAAREWHGQRACACAAGNRGSSPCGGCSAGTYAYSPGAPDAVWLSERQSLCERSAASAWACDTAAGWIGLCTVSARPGGGQTGDGRGPWAGHPASPSWGDTPSSVYRSAILEHSRLPNLEHSRLPNTVRPDGLGCGQLGKLKLTGWSSRRHARGTGRQRGGGGVPRAQPVDRPVD